MSYDDADQPVAIEVKIVIHAMYTSRYSLHADLFRFDFKNYPKIRRTFLEKFDTATRRNTIAYTIFMQKP